MGLSDFLDQTCDLLLQPKGKQDAAGGADRTGRSVQQADVPCGVREMGGSTDPKNGKRAQTKIVRVYFDPEDLDVAVTAKTLIRLTSVTPGCPPRELVILSTSNINTRGELLQVDCEEQTL